MDDQAFELLMDKLKTHDDKFMSLEEKVDLILQWKWKLVGGTLVVSAGVTALIQIASLILR